MTVEHIFKHPDDTPEQRLARAHELVMPFFRDMINNRPEYAKRILYAEKFDVEGNVYFENGFGNRIECPEYLMHRYPNRED